jgi:hypothetical protein
VKSPLVYEERERGGIIGGETAADRINKRLKDFRKLSPHYRYLPHKGEDESFSVMDYIALFFFLSILLFVIYLFWRFRHNAMRYLCRSKKNRIIED